MAYINVNSPVVSISTSLGASVRVALPTAAAPLPISMLVTNSSDTIIFIKTGDSTVTAAATDFPVLPGTVIAVTKDSAHTHVAAFCAAASKVIYFAQGGSQ